MEVLKPLIEQLVEMVKSGKDIVSGNLPDVMQQIIVYESWFASFWLKIACLIFVIGLSLAIADHWITKGDPYAEHISACIGCFVMLFGLLVGGINYSNLKKIQMAPKVYMIETLSHYLRHNN